MAYTRWTEDEEKLLSYFYPLSHMRALARIFTRFSPDSIWSKATNIGLSKSKDYLRGVFKPRGKSPWNKGKVLKPAFNKYQIPGYGRVRKNNGFFEVFHDGKYQSLARVIWQKHHGQPVPNGMIIRYRDGNNSNVAIDNMYLSTKADLMRDSSFSNLPKEIREVHKMNKQIKRILTNE